MVDESKSKTKTILSTYVDQQLYDEIHALAAAADLNTSHYIRRVLRNHAARERRR